MIRLVPEKSEIEIGVEVEKGGYYKMVKYKAGVGGGRGGRNKNRPVRENWMEEVHLFILTVFVIPGGSLKFLPSMVGQGPAFEKS